MRQVRWTITEARQNLDVILARAEVAPQVITRGRRQFVVLNRAEYRRLTRGLPNLKDLILNGASLEEVDLHRGRSGPQS